jgi:hypothetical protein
MWQRRIFNRMVFLRACIYVAMFVFFCTARSALAIGVAPALVDVMIAPGATHQLTFSLRNDAPSSVLITVHAQNFIPLGEEGEQSLITEPRLTNLASWIDASSSTFMVDARSLLKTAVTIRVPEEATPGGYYATLLFSEHRTAASGNGIGITTSIGVPFLVQVKGPVHEELRLDTFQLQETTPLNHLPATFITRVRNLGTTHERVRGSIVIHDMMNRTVATIPVNPTDAAVLPGGVRRIVSAWSRGSAAAESGFWNGVRAEIQHIGIGRYRATLNAQYGSMNRSLSGTVLFWVLPWRLFMVGVVSVAGVLALLWLQKRWMIRRALRRTQQLLRS